MVQHKFTKDIEPATFSSQVPARFRAVEPRPLECCPLGTGMRHEGTNHINTIDTRILQTMVSGIAAVLGLGTSV